MNTNRCAENPSCKEPGQKYCSCCEAWFCDEHISRHLPEENSCKLCNRIVCAFMFDGSICLCLYCVTKLIADDLNKKALELSEITRKFHLTNDVTMIRSVILVQNSVRVVRESTAELKNQCKDW